MLNDDIAYSRCKNGFLFYVCEICAVLWNHLKPDDTSHENSESEALGTIDVEYIRLVCFYYLASSD